MSLEEQVNNIGIVVRIHSNYFYVAFENITWECMLRNKLKKEGVEPKVGDRVAIAQLNTGNNTAVITSILPRRNELFKPNISNIDQVVIVTSTDEPTFNPLILDKFIVMSESHNMIPLICINKSDKLDTQLKKFMDDTYSGLNYEVIYTSALTGEGLDLLKLSLLDKVTVLTGISGVGKSSLLNSLDSSLNLETGEVSKNLGTGRHTTRHVSLQKLVFKEKLALIADTPGFSYIEFNNINSGELAWNFSEFTPFISECPLRGCLHWQEPDCNLKKNIGTNGSRYLNYLNILFDILKLEKISKARSTKKETQVKITHRADGKNIRVIKLAGDAREDSRRTVKQELAEIGKINSLEDLDEEY